MARASNKLTEKEEVWAQAIARGETRADAEREANFHSGDSTRLLRRAAVLRRITELQRPYVVSWKQLLTKAQNVLDDHLDNGNEMAARLLQRLEMGGQITKLELRAFLKCAAVSSSDRNTAARLVIEAMAKINPKSLSDAASQEDAAQSRDEAIAAIMGPDADGPVASPDAPPDPDAETETIN